jgi:pilus assembly protein CpaE
MRSDNNSRSLRFVTIDSDQNMRTDLRAHLSERGYKVLAEATEFTAALRMVQGLAPEAVFLELPAAHADPMDMITTLRRELPDAGIIVSASDPSPQLILSSLRSGADEFLTRPIEPSELDRAIDHLFMSKVRPSDSGRKRGTILSLFATKGGVGATTIAANLAVALAQTDQKVLLLDLNFQMGESILHLDLPMRYSIADAVREGSVDQASLRNIMAQHDSGTFFMSAAHRPEDGADVDKDLVVELLGMVSTMFDYVIVDLGRHVDDRAIEVLDLSDRVMLLTELTFPAVRNTTLYLDLFRKLEIDTAKTLLMVNRYHKKYDISLEDLERTVEKQTYWVIPNDYKAVSSALAGGMPVVTSASRSKVSRNLTKLAETVCGTFEGSVDSEEAPELVS